jgi:hypothetical protein
MNGSARSDSDVTLNTHAGEARGLAAERGQAVGADQCAGAGSAW